MKTIRRWDDLRDYGIIVLTGEACGLSYRLLCDVTTRGKRTLEKALSVQELRLGGNWNCGSPGEPHVGSLMLAPECLTFVAAFALLESGCREAWATNSSGVVGIEPQDEPERLEAFRTVYAGELLRRFAYAGTAGDRNRHLMTGRVY